VALLLARRAVSVLILILDLLALGICVVGEELGDQNSRGIGLLGRGLLLLPGLSLLLFLGGTSSGGSGSLCFVLRIVVFLV